LLRGAAGCSIAFPAISTGIFGYPPAAATGLPWRRPGGCCAPRRARLTFACFDDATCDLYDKELGAVPNPAI